MSKDDLQQQSASVRKLWTQNQVIVRGQLEGSGAKHLCLADSHARRMTAPQAATLHKPVTAAEPISEGTDHHQLERMTLEVGEDCGADTPRYWLVRQLRTALVRQGRHHALYIPAQRQRRTVWREHLRSPPRRRRLSPQRRCGVERFGSARGKGIAISATT